VQNEMESSFIFPIIQNGFPENVIVGGGKMYHISVTSLDTGGPFSMVIDFLTKTLQN